MRPRTHTHCSLLFAHAHRSERCGGPISLMVLCRASQPARSPCCRRPMPPALQVHAHACTGRHHLWRGVPYLQTRQNDCIWAGLVRSGHYNDCESCGTADELEANQDLPKWDRHTVRRNERKLNGTVDWPSAGHQPLCCVEQTRTEM